jgi:uncharacterized protein
LYVNDYAGVISAEDAASIHALFSDLRRDTGIEATVLTVNSIHDYDTGDASIESFATNLFNTWGIGDQEKNNGVLILVAVRDRQVRIELGSGYKDAYNTSMQDIIQEQMLPLFKKEQYSRGIYNGAQAIANVLTGPAPTSKDQSVSLGLVVFALGVSIVIIGAIVMGVLGLQQWSTDLRSRHRQQHCPRCGSNMERDSSITHYDLWQCHECSHVVSHRRAGSHRRRSKTSSWNTGSRQHDDSFDSFSGGSSSGGGASGEW